VIGDLGNGYIAALSWFHTRESIMPNPCLQQSISEISMGMDNARQAWIADPDGNAIELMEYGHSSLQLTGS